jgi:hypothetical protein
VTGSSLCPPALGQELELVCKTLFLSVVRADMPSGRGYDEHDIVVIFCWAIFQDTEECRRQLLKVRIELSSKSSPGLIKIISVLQAIRA